LIVFWQKMKPPLTRSNDALLALRMSSWTVRSTPKASGTKPTVNRGASPEAW